MDIKEIIIEEEIKIIIEFIEIIILEVKKIIIIDSNIIMKLKKKKTKIKLI